MEKYVDLKQKEIVFQEGEWVYLRLQPFRQLSMAHHRSGKLASRFYRPFQITHHVRSVAYRL